MFKSIPIYERRYASILKQGLDVWMVNFGNAKVDNVSYFNPGLVNRPDGLWLVTRRSQNHPKIRVGMNSLMAFKLDENLVPMFGVPLSMQPKYDREHFEDARVIHNGNITYVSCTNFIVSEGGDIWTGAHQIIQTLHDNWISNGRYDPVYGRNMENIETPKGNEKNWLWFFHDNRMHMVYSAYPHVVTEFDGKFNPLKEHKTVSNLKWKYGEVRGGTPPILKDGLYWTFFHSSMELDNKYHRRYFMGAYAFEDKEPFRIVKITKEPLLAGSDEDLWQPRKPLVVFPVGSILQSEDWIISLGVNDLECAMARIPHDELLPRMISV